MKTREIYLSGLNAWLDAHGAEPMNGDPEWLAHEAGLAAVVAAAKEEALEEAATSVQSMRESWPGGHVTELRGLFTIPPVRKDGATDLLLNKTAQKILDMRAKVSTKSDRPATGQCPVTHPHIDGGAACRYLAGHESAGIPHTTENGTWWHEPQPIGTDKGEQVPNDHRR